MGVVAFRPFVVLLVHQRAERGLETVQHELLHRQAVFKLVEVQSEATFVHQLADQATFLSCEGERVVALVDFIQRIYFFNQVGWRETVQAVRRIGVAKHNHKGPVEVGRAVYFQLVGVGVPWKFDSFAFQKEDMQA